MNSINLKDLAKEIHENAAAKGFWSSEISDVQHIMLMITEVSEMIEADRRRAGNSIVPIWEFEKGFRAFVTEKVPFPRWIPEAHIELYNKIIKGSIEEELADTVIRIIDFMYAKGFEITKFDTIRVDYIHISSLAFDIVDYIISYKKYKEPVFLLHAIKLIFSYCEQLKIDMTWHIEQKMTYNKYRPFKHGKKY